MSAKLKDLNKSQKRSKGAMGGGLLESCELLDHAKYYNHTGILVMGGRNKKEEQAGAELCQA